MAAQKFTAIIDAPLTATQQASMNKAIQNAVLQQIARIDNGIIARKIGPVGGGQTDGIYIKNFSTLDALKKNAAFIKATLPKLYCIEKRIREYRMLILSSLCVRFFPHSSFISPRIL